jgi:O-antigen/teichoic acid export membrane protein
LWLGAAISLQVLPFLIDSFHRYPQFREGLQGFTRAEAREILSTAPGYWLQALLTTAFASLPIVGLGYWAAAPAAVAQFGLMRTVANVVRQVLQMFGNVFGLELGRRVVLDDKAGFASIFFETSRFLAAQSTVAAVVLLMLGRELFILWTGQAILYNVTMLLLAIAPPILIPSMIASTEAVTYAGRPWLIVQARLAQFALSLLLIVALPIADPAMRMMAALACGEIFAFAVPLIFVIRHINPAVGFAMQARLIRLVLLSAMTAGLVMAPMQAITDWTVAARLGVGAVLAVVAICICVAFWGVDGVRRRAIIALVKARWRGIAEIDPAI